MCALIARRFIATTPRWGLTKHAQQNANFTTSLIVNNGSGFQLWLFDQRCSFGEFAKAISPITVAGMQWVVIAVKQG
jgi:hypothetical protein